MCTPQFTVKIKNAKIKQHFTVNFTVN